MILVVVEAPIDREIVGALLKSSGIADFKIEVVMQPLYPERYLSRFHLLPFPGPCLIVYDQEDGSVGDAVALNGNLKTPSWMTFCPAIPTVEAWLFADSNALFEVLGDRAVALLGRMPLPEQIPYPKLLRHALLREEKKLHELLERIDITVAVSRSPSLKYFLRQAHEKLGLEFKHLDQLTVAGSQLERGIIRNLLSEVYPSKSAIFRSASGAVFTAEEMMQEISDGTEIGREYGSDVLRVARDLLARQARRKNVDE